MKTYIIGPYPPPLGGISVYIYRYASQLIKEGKEVVIIDFSKKSVLTKIKCIFIILLDPRPAIYHLNVISPSIMLALFLRPFSAYRIFQDHSGRSIGSLRKYNAIIFKLFLSRVDKLILVGSHLQEYYAQSGYTLPKNIQIKNAFLPPPLEDENSIWNSYDPAITHFIENHSPLVVANAYKIAFHEAVDLYGLDLCIQLVKELKDDYPTIGLLFALAEIGDEEYYHKTGEMISRWGIDSNICFMTGQKELWPLFRKADVMVRPTAVDSYGVSVAEALYFGCPAVASDVCERAPGTVIFRNRDMNDFLLKVKEVLGGASG